MMSFVDKLFSRKNAVDFSATFSERGWLGYLVFDDTGISFHKSVTLFGSDGFTIPAEQLCTVDVYDISNETSRTTLPRLMLLKWYAFAFPKQETTIASRIDITDIGGQFYSFTLHGVNDAEVWSKISRFVHDYLSS